MVVQIDVQPLVWPDDCEAVLGFLSRFAHGLAMICSRSCMYTMLPPNGGHAAVALPNAEAILTALGL